MRHRASASLSLIWILPLTLSGCMSATIQESRELPTQIVDGEAVVILAKPQIEGVAAEDEFMDCVGRGLAKGEQPIAVRDNNAFVDELFPWFEPGTAPTRPEAVTQLLARPGVGEKVAASGVRYLVWLDGGTRRTDGGGSLACGAAPGGRRMHRFRLVGKGIGLRGDRVGLEAGKIGGQRGDERHRNVGDRGRCRALALHCSGARDCMRSFGRTITEFFSR